MKVFEVAVKKNRVGNECGLIWPSFWGEVYERVSVLAYQDEGLAVEGAICVCQDDVWQEIEAKNDNAVMLLTKTQANEKGRKWRPQVTRVTDEQKVLLIVAKAVQGTKLTAEDKKALNPDDPSPGVGKSKLFEVGESLVTEA